jgi:hypothetical protein
LVPGITVIEFDEAADARVVVADAPGAQLRSMPARSPLADVVTTLEAVVTAAEAVSETTYP